MPLAAMFFKATFLLEVTEQILVGEIKSDAECVFCESGRWREESAAG